MAETKYIAIKVRGLHHWVWFKREKAVEDKGVFTGTEGWGRDGEFTEITVSTEEIDGRIASNALQYGDD